MTMELDTRQLTELALSLAGEAAANRALLSVLIAAHPMPDAVRELWHAYKPEVIDQEADELPFLGQRPYQLAFLQRLAGLSGEIDAAELGSRPAGPAAPGGGA